MKKLYKENALKNVENKKIKININVIDSPRRKYSVFIGASIIGNYYNTGDSEDYWVVNGTTDEIRPYRILYKEC